MLRKAEAELKFLKVDEGKLMSLAELGRYRNLKLFCLRPPLNCRFPHTRLRGSLSLSARWRCLIFRRRFCQFLRMKKLKTKEFKSQMR